MSILDRALRIGEGKKFKQFQKHVARIGHLFDCVAYGPGILDLAHRPDEWVGIDDMVEAAQVMAIGLDILLKGSGRSENRVTEESRT